MLRENRNEKYLGMWGSVEAGECGAIRIEGETKEHCALAYKPTSVKIHGIVNVERIKCSVQTIL